MGAAEQQDQLVTVARRFAAVAPAGWARLVGHWEATPDPGGGVTLNWITTAVVNGGDRWLYGQVGYDEELYDAVARLNELAAQDDPDRRWTTFELLLDADGAFHVDVGYDPPKRSRGIHDEESLGRFETYLDTWVAEHGTVPPAGRRAVSEALEGDVPNPYRAAVVGARERERPVAADLRDDLRAAVRAMEAGARSHGHDPDAVPLTSEQAAVVGRIADALAAVAPAGWVRLVSRQECSTAAGSAGVAGAQVVVRATPGGLVQEHLATPGALYFTIDDLLEELAAASPTGGVTMTLVVDRGGAHGVRVVTGTGRALDGDRAELRAVHDYLENHRGELEELAARAAES